MIRVLYILDPAVTGGATKSIVGMINQVQMLGVVPVVCTSGISYINEYLSNAGVSNFAIGHSEMITNIHPGKFRGRWFNIKKTYRYIIQDIRAFRQVKKHIDLHEIDIIHTNSSRSDIGFFISRFYRIPHIVHLREYGDLDYNCYPLNPFYITYYNAWTNRFLCVSDAIKSYWEHKGIDGSKTRVVYNGIDINNISVSSDKSKTKPSLRIVMSGVMRYSKGQHLAVEAIGLLPDSIRRKVEIDFIGWKDESYIQVLINLAKQYKIESNVHILEPVEDVLPLLGDYQVGLMCSQSEGFGRTTAEYMHARLGVIASDSGANPELIENGNTGLLFISGNAASLSEKIQLFFRDRELLIACSNAAQNKALSEYTALINAKKVVTHYMDVLG